MSNQSITSQKSRQQSRDTAASATTYRGFLVRMWKDGAAGLWRSSAQSVQTGEIVRFASLTGLFAFLEAQTNELADVFPDEPPAEEPSKEEPSEEEPRVGWRSSRGRS